MKFDHVFELLPERAFCALGGRLLTLEGGGKGGGSKAPVPDYATAAKETAKGDLNSALASGALNRPTQINPYGELTWTLKPGANPRKPNPGDWIQTQKFSEPQQAIYEQESANDLALARIAGQGVTNAGNVLGKDFDAGTLPTAPGNIVADPNAFAEQRQQVQDATYNRATQYYDDRFAKNEAAMKQELANKGLTEGSEAYRNALLEFGRGRDTAYADATDRAVLAGGQEQSRMQSALINAMQQQQNRRNNALQEALTLRQLPLNEINALRSGVQLQNPQFASFSQTPTVSGPDYLTAAGQQYNAAAGNAAAQNAAAAQNNATWGNLAASALMSFDW